MENRKKKFRLLGHKPKELVHFGLIVGACIGGWQYFDDKFDGIDQRFEQVNQRFEQVNQRFEKVDVRLDNIDRRLDKIGVDLNKTSSLLDAYLTWRFIYVNDPARKDLVPVYDPRTRTLDFVSKK